MTDTPREKFQDLLNGFSSAMLVTKRPDGALRARPMNVAKVESDADLWFVTELDSGKIAEIATNPTVCVTFQGGKEYLSVTGEAQVVTDRSMVDELWNEAWRVWFPDGKESPDLSLLHVQASEGGYWDNSGLEGWTYLFKAGKAYLRGEKPEVGEDIHQKVKL